MIRKSNIKLIIQIPCFNEEQSLPVTLKRIPREFPGVDKTEILIIDDGSTDKTAEVALKLGVDHIVKINHHQGLAKAFKEGVEACIKKGADIIVNTDADNQYCGEEIAKLIEAIITGKADLVIGQRDFSKIEHFSHFKKISTLILYRADFFLDNVNNHDI